MWSQNDTGRINLESNLVYFWKFDVYFVQIYPIIYSQKQNCIQDMIIFFLILYTPCSKNMYTKSLYKMYIQNQHTFWTQHIKKNAQNRYKISLQNISNWKTNWVFHRWDSERIQYGHPYWRSGQSSGETLSPPDQSDGWQPPRHFQPAKGVAIPSATIEPTTGVRTRYL